MHNNNSFSTIDVEFMARALYLAKKGWFGVKSNPRVGCVLVKEQKIVGEGWHKKTGLAHAEVSALLSAGEQAKGSTAYVTLEPCAHQGKTPPCAQALIDAGVIKVICAMQDPNPQVAGKGFSLLRKAGIECDSGLMQVEAEQLNLGFIKRMKHNLPRVSCKLAMSLDGRTAMAGGRNEWITADPARDDVQSLRAQVGAIITGSGTVIMDNPSMSVRAEQFLKNKFFFQPLRVVIDSQGLIGGAAKIFQQEGLCWLVSNQLTSKEYPLNVSLKSFPNAVGKVDLKAVLTALAKEGINDVLVEAGSGLVGAFIAQELVDELVIYLAPKLMGNAAQPLVNLPFDNMKQAIKLQLTDSRMIGDDMRLTYQLVNEQ